MCSALQSDVFLYIGVRVLWAHWAWLTRVGPETGSWKSKEPSSVVVSSRDQANTFSIQCICF